jgi:hypothetical protein
MDRGGRERERRGRAWLTKEGRGSREIIVADLIFTHQSSVNVLIVNPRIMNILS